jgi:rhodanese-related sulfurtransferase
MSPTSNATRMLGIGAAVLGVLAAFAGSPYSSQRARIDVDALARAVRNEDDHVTAIELAGWIKGRRDRLRIIDVRSAGEYEEFHIPTAERIAIDSLASARFASDETIVLYSEGGPHAAQAWVFLRALGYDRVFFLRGGIYEWLEQVMNPTLGANASRADSAAFTSVAAISRYFGGTPHIGVARELDDAIALPVAHADSAAPRGDLHARNAGAIAKIRRRGC